MISGIVTFRQVLRHPILVIRTMGWRRFWKFVRRGCSRKDYRFLDLVMETTDTVATKTLRPR